MRKARGQTLVIFAILVFVGVTLVTAVYGVTSARRQKNAIQEVTWAAVRHGSMELDEDALANGEILLVPAEAEQAARATLADGLGGLPFALASGETPEGIAFDPSKTEVYAVNASAAEPWTSPWTGQVFTQPVVAVRVVVPSNVLFLSGVRLSAVGEDFAFVRGTP